VANPLVACITEVVEVIPVLGFAVVNQFAKADRLLASIDYPVDHLVIVDNSGTAFWNPVKPEWVANLWVVRVPFGLGLVGAWNLVIKSTPYAPYWLLINDDAWFEPGALQQIADGVDPSTLNFIGTNPEWSGIAIGEKVVETVGLYDERFYPLYFDDNDYERRITNAGFVINRIGAVVHHENSSTLHSGFQEKNAVSFRNNQLLYETKVAVGDYSEGNWSLAIRRANRWD
jgi:GT2 family glycosyltransferase